MQQLPFPFTNFLKLKFVLHLVTNIAILGKAQLILMKLMIAPVCSTVSVSHDSVGACTIPGPFEATVYFIIYTCALVTCQKCPVWKSNANETHTAWSDGAHQSVHLDVPVFDIGARLAEFPLGSLSETKCSSMKHLLLQVFCLAACSLFFVVRTTQRGERPKILHYVLVNIIFSTAI